MPSTVVLSQINSVGGWGKPISFNVSLNLVAVRPLWKSPPSLASAADAATSLRIETVTMMYPFKQSGSWSCCLSPIKKYPAKLLLAMSSFKYEASLLS